MQLCPVSSFYRHGIKNWWRWGEDLCPLDSLNRQCHPSRACPQWCQLPRTDCSFWCVHAQLDTQCIVSWHRKSTGSSYEYACASAFNMDITRDAPRSLCLFEYTFPRAASLVNSANGPVLIICCHHYSSYKPIVLQPYSMQHQCMCTPGAILLLPGEHLGGKFPKDCVHAGHASSMIHRSSCRAVLQQIRGIDWCIVHTYAKIQAGVR